ncbi:hypothetical protein QBC40DRAFT_151022, partial [Triangularia verruculosa]
SGNRVKTGVNLLGYTKIRATELKFVTGFDNSTLECSQLYALVFKYASGGALLPAFEKQVYSSFRGDALKTWTTILRYIYEVGTAIRDLPDAHRAVHERNILLRRRQVLPAVVDFGLARGGDCEDSRLQFADRYEAVLADPCPPWEQYDIGVWGPQLDLPRPVDDPAAGRGEDAMAFGLFIMKLLRTALPALHDYMKHPDV